MVVVGAAVVAAMVAAVAAATAVAAADGTKVNRYGTLPQFRWRFLTATPIPTTKSHRDGSVRFPEAPWPSRWDLARKEDVPKSRHAHASVGMAPIS